ncbi:MAG: hypothetical protein J6C26_08250 [Clostridia bacterium]|nr:hypothetical protein [Clostridia bacterium]
MNFSGFYGNEPIKKALNAHLFHAYLIEGPEGSGKHTLANIITNALVCDGEIRPCGICRQCYKFKQNCHPDIIDIPSDIPVEDLRRLLADIVLTPNDGEHKIYRIDKAEKMLPAAQNLLLKTLEEPPHYAVFLLLCTAKEGVLPTVRSRCQVLSLAPLPEEILEEHFRKTFGVYDEKAKTAVLLSAGFLGKALEIYGTEDEKQGQQCRALEQALQKKDAAAVLGVFHFEDRESLTAFYNTFALHLKRRLRDASGSETTFYASLIRLWDSAGEAMQTNINVKFWNANLARLCLKAIA